MGPFKTRGPATGLIIKDGYIVADWGQPDRVDMTFSVTKTFLSSTVGLAYDRGMIQIEDPVHKDIGPVVPFKLTSSGDKSDSWNRPDVLPLFESEHNQAITWDHLLRQTSDWEGTLWGKPDWADRPRGEADSWTTR
ncbi:MAG: serine hydrolase, partial [Pseudomonadota bacterium]